MKIAFHRKWKHTYMLQFAQTQTKARHKDQVVIYCRQDECVCHICSTFQEYFSLGSFQDKISHLAIHLILVLLHLKTWIKWNPEQFNWSFSPAFHVIIGWYGSASSGSKLQTHWLNLVNFLSCPLVTASYSLRTVPIRFMCLTFDIIMTVTSVYADRVFPCPILCQMPLNISTIHSSGSGASTYGRDVRKQPWWTEHLILNGSSK